MVRMDCVDYAEKFADDSNAGLKSKDSAIKFKTVRTLKAKTKRRTSFIADDDGKKAVRKSSRLFFSKVILQKPSVRQCSQ